MRDQRAHGHWPQARRHVVVGGLHPVVHAAVGMSLHHAHDLGLALEAMGLEVLNAGACVVRLVPQVAHDVAVRGQDEFDAVLRTSVQQLVE